MRGRAATPIRRPFEEVVTVHGPAVLRLCRALLPAADADDAWSETFLAALRAYPRLPAGANVEAWLVTIAHRKAIDLHRAERRRPTPVAEIPAATTARPGPEPADDELRAAFDTLSARQRQSIAYHHLAGLPYAEVAALVGGTPEAARRSAADGIKILRRRFRAAAGAARPLTAVPTPDAHPLADAGGTR